MQDNMNMSPEDLEIYGNKLMEKITKVPDFLKNVNHDIKISEKREMTQPKQKSSRANSSSKIEKLLKKYNNEYLEGIKDEDKLNKNKVDVQSELDRLVKNINKIKSVNRDEELLRMQKKNQEIEIELFDLKNQDKTKLIEKEEESKKLVIELNELFQNKMNETLIKDKERKSAIEEIKNIKKQQDDLNAQIAKNNEDISDLEKDVRNLEHQVENYETYKQFIDKVIEKSNEGNSNNNNDYDKLKEKFENLIERMNEIKDDIDKQEIEIKEKKIEQAKLLKTDEKQNQNQKVLKLEEEAKELTRENEML
jgi:hypothetical protein